MHVEKVLKPYSFSKNDNSSRSAEKNKFWKQRKKAILLTILGVILISGVIALVVSLTKKSNNSQDQKNGNLPIVDYNDPKLFDDSAQPNPNVPPLKDPFPYGKTPVRGVNLGGWLVLEPFLTPSLFEQFQPSQPPKVVDEYTFCQTLGREESKRQLEKHYDTWVNEDHFKKFAEYGLNHVRIPIGYWALDTQPNEPYLNGSSWNFLLRGINWARKYGIRVQVEIHAAPGSQNGWNHSGRLGVPGWLNGTDAQENAKRTTQILSRMAYFFSDPKWNKVVTMYGLINEPTIDKLPNINDAVQWYEVTRDAVLEPYKNRGIKPEPQILIHEGFLGFKYWNSFLQDPKNQQVLLDAHMYIIFDKNVIFFSQEKQLEIPCKAWNEQITSAQNDTQRIDLIFGEVSVAHNDCAYWLNGVGEGARYEGKFSKDPTTSQLCPQCTCQGINDWKSYSNEYKSFLRKFADRQIDVLEKGIGWFYWNFKTENGVNPHWDYLLGVEQGWIPKDPSTARNACSSN